MDFFSILTMIGGLALFLYGMKTMGDSLSKLAGGKLEHVLETMTNNPLKAVLLGAGVTAVIQSSSATTVMVVGFVNSGIMKLSQAVGVIMGANVGTTITSWMLSLTGIEGGNFLLKMMKPSSFSPILALIGIVLLMQKKNSNRNDIGQILLGFAVLMFGMETMSEAVKPLADIPEFKSLFTAFENPILGMIVGALLTAAIQSSSASVGILQSMCATGSVSVSAAVPIIMGQNIGTCITALISGVGASKNARRASMVHLFFNAIGTAIFMIVFYGLNAFIGFAFMSDAANQATIAIIHTIFNVGATVLILPFSRYIEKLTYVVIPKTDDEENKEEVVTLDERLLQRPAFAVAQCKNVVCDIAKLCEESMGLIIQVSNNYDQLMVDRIMAIEEDIDKKEDDLSAYLLQLSASTLSLKDSKTVSKLSRCLIDFERVSDYEKGIAYTLQKMHDKEETFSKKATIEFAKILAASMEAIEGTVECFIHGDANAAAYIDPLADVISVMKKDIRKNHKKRLKNGKCSVELGMALNDMTNSLERIAKHCSNIAEEEIALSTEKYELHEYARTMKEDSSFYRNCIKEYEERYAIKKKDKGNQN